MILTISYRDNDWSGRIYYNDGWQEGVLPESFKQENNTSRLLFDGVTKEDALLSLKRFIDVLHTSYAKCTIMDIYKTEVSKL